MPDIRPTSNNSYNRPKKTKPWFKKVQWKKFFLSLFAMYVVFYLLLGFWDIYHLKKQQANIDEKIEAARTEQAKLQSDIDYINTEDAIEKIAREQLGMVKADEILVMWAGSQGQ